MKKIVFLFLLISTSFYAQNYEKNWAKVIENENNGKIKSANEIVDKIYKRLSPKKTKFKSSNVFSINLSTDKY